MHLVKGMPLEDLGLEALFPSSKRAAVAQTFDFMQAGWRCTFILLGSALLYIGVDRLRLLVGSQLSLILPSSALEPLDLCLPGPVMTVTSLSCAAVDGFGAGCGCQDAERLPTGHYAGGEIPFPCRVTGE